MLRSNCRSYILQSIRAKFNQYQVSKLCPLCRESDETLQHFILQCVTLQSTRRSFINALYEIVGSTNDEELLRLILDPSTACAHSGNSDEPWLTHIYSLTRRLCFALHVQRNTLLASLQSDSLLAVSWTF